MKKQIEGTRLITLTEAAYILGYKTYRSVANLTNEGHLATYSLPGTKRKRVKLQEVMNLAKPAGIPQNK
ncbi:MAG: hypothetical protein QNL93_11860 [Opitutae bacterium]|jgi:hypothetical protein